MNFRQRLARIANSDRPATSAPAVPCTEDSSCEHGAHTYSWPCDYAPGSGRLADTEEGRRGIKEAFGVSVSSRRG